MTQTHRSNIKCPICSNYRRFNVSKACVVCTRKAAAEKTHAKAPKLKPETPYYSEKPWGHRVGRQTLALRMLNVEYEDVL